MRQARRGKQKPCSVEGCWALAESKGLCHKRGSSSVKVLHLQLSHLRNKAIHKFNSSCFSFRLGHQSFSCMSSTAKTSPSPYSPPDKANLLDAVQLGSARALPPCP